MPQLNSQILCIVSFNHGKKNEDTGRFCHTINSMRPKIRETETENIRRVSTPNANIKMVRENTFFLKKELTQG